MFQGAKPRPEPSRFPLSSLGLVPPQNQTNGPSSWTAESIWFVNTVKSNITLAFIYCNLFTSPSTETAYPGSLAFVLLPWFLQCLLCQVRPAHQPLSLLPVPHLPPACHSSVFLTCPTSPPVPLPPFSLSRCSWIF